ncbi:hypothetical protein [Asticcacaulis excentricus]|uniref:Uncharacterized protein n=1 Tax=Asticcacaulis excentricus TaxID=78587 RepID=A0A3G9G7B7_9CAUL|nr:hypothetical protein [Asticcacaulis excentricus]BBF81865.1 hypothetical protein EM6_2473 [Asticcacaulis excentricus]
MAWRSVAASRLAKTNEGREHTTRAATNLTLSLTYGRPDITPETKITVTGFKAEINAQKWIVVSARHEMHGTGGSQTSLQLESL